MIFCLSSTPLAQLIEILHMTGAPSGQCVIQRRKEHGIAPFGTQKPPLLSKGNVYGQLLTIDSFCNISARNTSNLQLSYPPTND